MRTRTPVVAGQFYPGSRDGCLEEIREALASRPVDGPLPEPIVGGIVPHAGWTFSGDVAAMVFAAVKKQRATVDTFIIFGTAHSYFGPSARHRRQQLLADASWRHRDRFGVSRCAAGQEGRGQGLRGSPV